MKIAVLTLENLEADFDAALTAHDTTFVPRDSNLLEELRRYDHMRYDAFLIMDGVIEEDSSLLSQLKSFQNDTNRPDDSNLVPVFIANAFRECPSSFFKELVDIGIYQIVVGDKNDNYLTKLVKVVSRPLQRKDVLQYCSNTVPVVAKKLKQNQPAVAHNATTRICVAQGNTREGSTHLTFVLSRSLALLGYRVATVVPQRHFEDLKRVYSAAYYSKEIELMRMHGLDIYPGETPAVAVDGYDYIVCDMDRALWIYDRDSLDFKVRAEELRRTFYAADVRIFSSFLDPTGWWGASAAVAKMDRRDLARTKFAVFGIMNHDVFAKLNDYVHSHSDKAMFCRIEPILAPLYLESRDDIPDFFFELLSQVLPVKNQEAISKELDQANSDSAHKGRSFLSRIFTKEGE